MNHRKLITTALFVCFLAPGQAVRADDESHGYRG